MEFQTPSHRFSIAEIIHKSASLYVARFELFLIPFLITNLVSNIIGQFIWELLPEVMVPSDFTEEFALWVLDYLVILIPTIAVTLFIGWLLATIATGISVKTSSDLIEGRRASLGVSFSHTFSRLSTLLAAGFLTGTLFILGLIVLVIPGIIVAIMFSLTVQVIMLEKNGAFESLRRSRKLAANEWGKIFMILLFVIFFVVAANMAGETVSEFFVGNIIVLKLFVASFISALAQPLYPITLTYLYYAFRIEEKAAEPKISIQPTYPKASPMPIPMTQNRLFYQPKFCYKCGQSLTPDAVFCPQCGVRVKPR